MCNICNSIYYINLRRKKILFATNSYYFNCSVQMSWSPLAVKWPQRHLVYQDYRPTPDRQEVLVTITTPLDVPDFTPRVHRTAALEWLHRPTSQQRHLLSVRRENQVFIFWHLHPTSTRQVCVCVFDTEGAVYNNSKCFQNTVIYFLKDSGKHLHPLMMVYPELCVWKDSLPAGRSVV